MSNNIRDTLGLLFALIFVAALVGFIVCVAIDSGLTMACLLLIGISWLVCFIVSFNNESCPDCDW